MSLSHRERVQTALARERPDRCPMQISFTPEFAIRLCAHMNIDIKKLHNPHGGGNTYELERKLDEDMILTSVGWANSYYQQMTPGIEYTDEWGVGWKATEYNTKFGKGIYTEMIHHPLADDSAIANYKPPDAERPDLYSESEMVINTLKNDYWIVGVTVCTIFETAWALRGYEQILSDFIINPELVEELFKFPFHYHLTAAKKLVEMGVDMIWIGDDFGTQTDMLISPELWKRFLKPKMAEFISTIKKINPELKVAYHSDGNIYPIIPELIEIGLDVLNPIQPASMDPAKLKKDFGDKLCFWGSIDEQNTLPFGSPETVRREVNDRIRTIGKNGGLIIGPTHHVQLDTPIENFQAMVESIHNSY